MTEKIPLIRPFATGARNKELYWKIRKDLKIGSRTLESKKTQKIGVQKTSTFSFFTTFTYLNFESWNL